MSSINCSRVILGTRVIVGRDASRADAEAPDEDDDPDAAADAPDAGGTCLCLKISRNTEGSLMGWRCPTILRTTASRSDAEALDADADALDADAEAPDEDEDDDPDTAADASRAEEEIAAADDPDEVGAPLDFLKFAERDDFGFVYPVSASMFASFCLHHFFIHLALSLEDVGNFLPSTTGHLLIKSSNSLVQ
tara:strand:+ start:120 stop:698 length:579 start_codon:yes stop_codon:yes gene_type:complete